PYFNSGVSQHCIREGTSISFTRDIIAPATCNVDSTTFERRSERRFGLLLFKITKWFWCIRRI
ncbi:hypothetical protein RhiirB3_527996, partial [Rhizophagus irregularis]